MDGFGLYSAFIARAYPLPDTVKAIEDFISAATIGPVFFTGAGAFNLDAAAIAQWNQDYLKLISTDGQGRYGDYVRLLVFETVVLQALAGAPCQELCALPMKVNNISQEAVEAALSQRS